MVLSLMMKGSVVYEWVFERTLAKLSYVLKHQLKGQILFSYIHIAENKLAKISYQRLNAKTFMLDIS